MREHRSRWFVKVAIASTLVVSPVRAQTTVASTTRAQAVVAAAVDAMGGIEALQAVADVTREMAGNRSDIGQGLRPVKSGVTEPPVVNHPSVTLVLDTRGQRVLNLLRDTILGGQPMARRTVAGASGGFSANDIARTVSPMSPQAANNVRLGMARRYPELLLVQAWNRREQLRSLADASIKGKPQHVIGYADPAGVHLTLYFDVASKLLTKFETIGDDPIIGDAAFELYYSDWRQVGRIKLPYRYAERTNGVLLQELQASSITTDTGPADSLFAQPTGYEPTPPAAPPAPKKLADDVYLLPGAYNSLAVVFNDHVVVIEAGGSSGATQSAIGEVGKIAPGKPVRYVVSTHFHFDHLSGVRSYVAEGATIITTADARSVIENAAPIAHVLRPDALSRKPRAPTIEAMSSPKRVLTDGVHTVELYEIGPNPHVAQMIVAYLPNERILYEADMLDLDVPDARVGSPSVGADTRALAAAIEQLGLTVETIVPTHGRLGTINDLRQTIARR